MGEYKEALDNEGWSAHYNLDSLNSVVNAVNTGNVSVWSKELVDITKEGETVLEIGCGSGENDHQTSAYQRRIS